MKRVALVFALTTSLVAHSWKCGVGQEAPAVEISDETAKIAARKLFEDAKRKAEPFVEQGTKQSIQEKEIELNAIRPRAEQLRREMRLKDINGGIPGTVDNLTGKRAGDDAELNARDADIKRITESIEKLKQEREINVLKAAWLLLSHEKRTQIIDSGCLSDEETTIVQSTVKVEKIDSDQFQNSIGMQLRQIPAGVFNRGRQGSEVKISSPFWMAETEVTQKQYQDVTGENPSKQKSSGFLGIFSSSKYDKYPIDTVDWYQAVAFCRALSGRDEEKSAKRWYRLPTEAEWEYACRAGTTSSFHFGSFQSVKGTEANIDWTTFGSKYTEKSPVAVRSFAPNGFGLFDMHGNVAEWCSDWYQENYYAESPSVDPKGPAMGELVTKRSGNYDVPEWPDAELKVKRGGAFSSKVVQDACTSSARSSGEPTDKFSMGIRVVCEVADEPSGILQEQYQQLADFEAGKTRFALLKAQKQYYADLKALRDSKLELAKKLELSIAVKH